MGTKRPKHLKLAIRSILGNCQLTKALQLNPIVMNNLWIFLDRLPTTSQTTPEK